MSQIDYEALAVQMDGIDYEVADALRQAGQREQRVREWIAKQDGPLHIREACAKEVLAALDCMKDDPEGRCR